MSGSTTFKISTKVDPFSLVRKRQADITSIIFDFTRWLDEGEQLLSLSSFALAVTDLNNAALWQVDFPVEGAIGTPPADTNTLFVQATGIDATGTLGEVLVGGGTPDLSYIVSFLATASSQRQKEIDFIVNVAEVVNPNMITVNTPPVNAVTVVTNTVVLPTGTAGSVNVKNSSGAAITVTLPSSPSLDQYLKFKDVTGNAQTYNITIQGAGGALIDGISTFVLDVNYQAAEIYWTGSQWSVR